MLKVVYDIHSNTIACLTNPSEGTSQNIYFANRDITTNPNWVNVNSPSNMAYLDIAFTEGIIFLLDRQGDIYYTNINNNFGTWTILIYSSGLKTLKALPVANMIPVPSGDISFLYTTTTPYQETITTPYEGSASYTTTPYQGSASYTTTPYQGSASYTTMPPYKDVPYIPKIIEILDIIASSIKKSTEDKKTKIVSEEMNKMKNLISYDRKTQ
jgi:hypothetical protein